MSSTMGDPFPVVRLRGVPYQCREADIKEFFAGLYVVGLIRTGRHSWFAGDVFVVFPDDWQALLARQRAGHNMGINRIEMVWCDRRDFEHAILYGNQDNRGFTKHLRLWGLPWGVRSKDIASFFSDFHVEEDRIQITRGADGRCTGEAFVEFRSADEARRALMCKDLMRIGTRCIEIFPAQSPLILPTL